MKFSEINAIYTNMVTEWIGKGYTINAGTMGGSQTDEMAHIDLTDGRYIYRIVMESFCDRENDLGGINAIRIVAGRATDKVAPNREREIGGTIWNNRIEVMEIRQFYQISESYWGTKEEAVAAAKRRSERYFRKAEAIREHINRNELESPKAVEIAKRFLARKTGKSRIDSGAIKVTKAEHGYIIDYFSYRYRMA